MLVVCGGAKVVRKNEGLVGGGGVLIDGRQLNLSHGYYPEQTEKWLFVTALFQLKVPSLFYKLVCYNKSLQTTGTEQTDPELLTSFINLITHLFIQMASGHAVSVTLLVPVTLLQGCSYCNTF